ncbi:hypothetical protein QVD99_008285 [Batrachochytrium dendrobatidis]|nr:hypothetical protein O5D80_007158 [Batrachochytrium dendrobatidis]KAK5664737.1 hypothetical protein QVD99_008285 [Batrachochytrium dendrobatidis]
MIHKLGKCGSKAPLAPESTCIISDDKANLQPVNVNLPLSKPLSSSKNTEYDVDRCKNNKLDHMEGG